MATTAPPSLDPPEDRTHDSRPLFALVLRLLSMVVLTISFATVKLLSERGVNLAETVFYRQLFAVPVVAAWALATDGWAVLKTERLGGHASRTVLGLVAMVLNFGAVSLLPLAEATTLGFTAPIFAILLSALVLREQTGAHRWAAVLLGFAGVVLIAGPNARDFPVVGVLVGLVAAVAVAAVSILLRRLSLTERPTAIVFWFSVLSVPPAGIAMIHFGQMHDIATFALLASLGISGGVAQLLMTSALRWGEVSLVLVMDYSSLLWATLAGFLLWNVLPGGWTWAGAVLIVGSGLFLVWREHRIGRDDMLRAEAMRD